MLPSSVGPQTISSGTVHLWQFDLAISKDQVELYRDLLSRDEN